MDPEILKLQIKWQNLYFPDLNAIFITPIPSTVYKLLDRVIVVRGGYPIPLGAKGTVVAITRTVDNYDGDITEGNLRQIDILMDSPFSIQSDLCEFKRHRIFRTSSTNMLINISHGRA